MNAPRFNEIVERVTAWRREAFANRNFQLAMLGAALVAGIDQLSKFWIVKHLRLPDRPGGRIEISQIFDLTYVQNTGASFGMLSGTGANRIILSMVAGGVALGLSIWLGRLKRAIPAAGVAFIVGGALGNLYDRIAYGFVIDFLDFSGLYFPWVFNVADAAINVGVALLLVDAWQTRHQNT